MGTEAGSAIEKNEAAIRDHYRAFWKMQGRSTSPPTLLADGLPPIMNIGYWAEGAMTGREAHIELVRQLASRVVPLADRRVLDVGCGIGGPAAILARDYRARVDGITIIDDHVALGRQLIEAAQLQDRVSLALGNAMNMDVDEGAYDVVFNLEAAHCFVDKHAFLAGALRSLRPGGRLVMADIVATSHTPLVNRQPALKLDLITATDWERQCQTAGLVVDEVTSISDEVYAGWRRWNNYGAPERRKRMLATRCPPDAAAFKRQGSRLSVWALERAYCRSVLHVGSRLHLRGYMLLAAHKPL